MKQLRHKLNFNRDWEFSTEEFEGPDQLYDKGTSWDKIILPHTPRIEELNVYKPFQGICWYRKQFVIDDSFCGKKVFIEFEAAMQIAEVWVNGVHKIKHYGGYLPFSIDITGEIKYGESNTIAVKLDNRDNGDVPPGKPQSELDFCYFGGIYRNVYLHITEKAYLTDPVYAGVTAGGGIFASYRNVSEESADVDIRVHVQNDYGTEKRIKVINSILDSGSNAVSVSESETKIVAAGSSECFEQALTVKNPKLWHPDSPNLYTIHTTVIDNGKPVDEKKTRIGIRWISFGKPDGFMINGRKLKIRGANRHQQFPYIGNAVSDNAHYRDAIKLKEAGFNFVRLGHYPQSPAFLEACDELGLMAVEPTPGWQYSSQGVFQELVIQNIRDMVRRDRNHPCIIMWEVSLNETVHGWPGASDDFFHKCHMTAHEEYPGTQMFTSGDTVGRANAEYVAFDVPYNEWDEENMARPLKSVSGKMGLDREYGDWEFGGNDSTTRKTRKDGEQAMLLQAWNFQWSHNRNRENPWTIGDCIWVGIDYNRGYCPPKPVCTCGVMDVFRIPKFAYYFYQSQRSPELKSSSADSGPVVYIASYWQEGQSDRKVVVYSNCQEVELFVNGKSLGKRKPDNGPDTPYGKLKVTSDPNYWIEGRGLIEAKNAAEELDTEEFSCFDGGNCKNLEHPPFTFADVNYQTGEISANGYIDGKIAASAFRRTPEDSCNLRLKIDTCGRNLSGDGVDSIIALAEVTDKNGTVVPIAENEVEFSVEGPAELIGLNPVKAEAGIAAIILKSKGGEGLVRVVAKAHELDHAVFEFEV